MDNIVAMRAAYVDSDLNEIGHQQPLGQLNYNVLWEYDVINLLDYLFQ